ncbi:MAG: T9SS type A sorting domain-containing protein [Bacteroidota bacterium]
MMNILSKVFLLILLSTMCSRAQSEFFVNSTLPSVQRDPQIVRDSAGNYAVVWRSENQIDSISKGDIYLQFFSASDQPIGSEILVNTVTANDQDKPAAAMNKNGDLIITWASYTGFSQIYDIKARIYKNRLPVGPEFTVNTTLAATQTNADAAADAAGNFIVVWDSWDQDGSDKGVFGQLIANNGTKIGSEFRINTTTAYSQAKPSVQYFPDGRFVVVWESWNQDDSNPSGYGVYGRIFNANGSGVVPEFRVNTFVTDYQWYADVETFSDNSFAVVWCSWEQDGFDGSIYLQRFTSSALKIGGEVPVNQTTADYQWLPKIKAMQNDAFIVCWSSWKQDGDREGVYARMYDRNGTPRSLETRVNDYTVNFQWEPDLIVTPSNEMVAVWSCWGKSKTDYDIVAKRFTVAPLQGYFDPSKYEHPSGISTAKFIVHRMDSTKLTGHQYEIRFDSLGTGIYRSTIVDLTDGDTVVPNFLMNRGERTLYTTEQFDGVKVEIRPELDLDLDLTNSFIRNNSNTNALLTFANPTIGTKLVAPIDIIMTWGNSDTTVAGQFTAPSDTAINISGQRVVILPFKAMNITDGAKIDFLVADGNNNKRFDFGERIILLTPVKYRKTSANTHCQLTNSMPSVNGKWPQAGDSLFIYTTRPLTKNDRYRFTTSPGTALSSGRPSTSFVSSFRLEQNYPNPFNPSTTIVYSVDHAGPVRLDIVNILGQHVGTLVDQFQNEGVHRTSFSAAHLASGIYFYTLQSDRRLITKKMLLVK